jgi:hypothetical protein
MPCPCRHSALETTAAEALIEAPNPLIAHQIEVNAEEAHEAAERAASVAKVGTIISLFQHLLQIKARLLTMVALFSDNGFEIHGRTNYSY